MPIRPVSENDHLNIYRQFNFGQLVQLNMLDTRVLARHKQLDYAHYLTATGLDAARFSADLTDSNRTLLGRTQFTWLAQQLTQSQAIWNVLGQQVLMAKMLIPAEILQVLGQITSGQATVETLANVERMLVELVTLKSRYLQGDPTLTAQEKARILTVVPYNLDAWDGYAYEREALYSILGQLGKKWWCWRAILIMPGLHSCMMPSRTLSGWSWPPVRCPLRGWKNICRFRRPSCTNLNLPLIP